MKIKFVILFSFITAAAFSDTGTIMGTIVDLATQQPLPGVNVLVEGTQLGTASDIKGHFSIDRVPNGFYHVRFSAIGYEPLVKLDIRVVSNRPAIINAELVQQSVELQGVTVSRAYFEKEKDAIVSSRTVDLNEIRRDPAGAIDIQRMMQALPSVVSASDQQNEIVVRGGAPGENLFIMDNIEIANPNHFSQPGTGGGPINMINTLFIDRVDFMAGAFPAKYGDKASSVMDISLREGSRTMHSQDVDMSMAGIGINIEGPIANGRGSYLSSIRKSYLDLIIANTGLTAIPRYWNTQTKLVFDITPTDKLMFNYIYGNDGIKLEGENSAWSRGAENVDVKDDQYDYGLTYKKLWGKNGLTHLTVGGTKTNYHYRVYRLDQNGKKRYYANEDFVEWDFQARSGFVWKPNKKLELSGGLDWKQLGVKHNAWIDQDTVWVYGYSFPTAPDTFQVIPESVWNSQVFPIIQNAYPDSIYEDGQSVWHYLSQNPDGGWDEVRFRKMNVVSIYDSTKSVTTLSHPRYGGYAQLKFHISEHIYTTIGLRAGYFEYTNFSWLAPRIGINYAVTPATSFSLAYGRHYQSPNLLLLAFDDANSSLKSKYNNQIVLGMEHFFSKDTRGTVEAYWKGYNDIPVNYAETTLDPSDRSFQLVNLGQAKSYGIELFLQKKMAKDLFGTFSYSWYRAYAKDVRTGKNDYYPQTFDFQHVVNLVGGYRIPMKGANIVPLPERNGLVRFIAKTLGLGSDELEFSVRYRYVGGKPYTPLVYDEQVQRWYEDPNANYNTERLLAYHRFDFMLMWHSHFRHFNLVSYFDMQNVFNRDNIWDIQNNADGTQSNIYQYKVMPVGGFTLEF